MKIDTSKAYKYFEGIEKSKEFGRADLELKKQELIKKYNQHIEEIDKVDFNDALYALIAIKDVVSLKEKEDYTFDVYPICNYELNNQIIPYNIIYLCKKNEKTSAMKEIDSRINEGTTYEPNDKYIFLGSFLGTHLIDKTITFNPNSTIKDNKEIKGTVFDERYNYIIDFMSKVSKFKLNGDYRDKDDLYQLAYVYAKPIEKKPKKVNKIKRLLLKRD